MKKIAAVFLILIAISPVFNFLRIEPQVVRAENQNWPGIDLNGDGRIDMEDSIQYLKANFLSYDDQSGNFYWKFSDPADTAMANSFIRSMFEVEYIRNNNDDITLLGFLDRATHTTGGMRFQSFDGTIVFINNLGDVVGFVVDNYLKNKELTTSMLTQALAVPKLLDLLTQNGVSANDVVTEGVEFLYEKALEWHWYITPAEVNWDKLTLDTGLAEITKYPNLAKISSVFRMVLKGYELLNVFVEHALDIWDIQTSASIQQAVKAYETFVETVRFGIELAGKLIKTALEGVTEKAVIAAITKGVVTAAVVGTALGGPLGGVLAGLGVAVTGIIIYLTVNDIIDKGLDFAADETLGLDLALYKRLSSEPNPIQGVSPWRIRVKIFDENNDGFIPWGKGCKGEKVFILVTNTGVKTLNVRAEPLNVPEGWKVDDQELDLDNWREVKDIRPGKEIFSGLDFWVTSGTIDNNWTPWDPSDDKWIPSQVNPANIKFVFNHDVFTDWWDVNDWVPGGLKFLAEKTVTFFNSVETYIDLTSFNLYPAKGDAISETVEVTNMKSETISFVLGVSYRDPMGESNKYNSQIEISPSGTVVLAPSEKRSFKIDWTVPLDAPTGFYQLAVNCWKRPYEVRYVDNWEWATVFFAYQLEILTPTTDHPADAGDLSNPNAIFVYVSGLPPLDQTPAFTIRIPPPVWVDQQKIQLVDELPVPFGYTLKIPPPIQSAEGLYDLEVGAYFGALHSIVTASKAVRYSSAAPSEPIEKGLAWLRTRQYSDGSWSSNVGVTSLTALAFLNAGYDETDPTVSKAINYILSKVHGDGSIYASYSVYETSTAILALVATHNAKYATIIENAKNWLIGAQQDETFGYTPTNYQYGGWTYSSATGDPDLSNTQFALLALDAANLPKTDPTWSKSVIFTQRCQNRPASNDQAWAHDSSRPSYNDGGFIYRPWGWSLAGGTLSYGSMTGAGIWGLLLSGVPKTDERVTAAMNWVTNHYTWDTNPVYGSRPYYYYLSMSKALTMYREPVINGHDWYQELYNKLVGMQIDAGSGKGYWSSSAEDYNPDLTTAYAILSLQTRAVAPPVQRLSYLTFILRSNCLIRIIDSEGNLVGYNYMTGLGENQIPTAVYSGPFSEPQYIVIVNPKPGTYKLELVGISEGPYTLTIQGNYGEEVTDTFEYTGYIKPAELHGSDVTVTAIVGPVDIYTAPPEFEEIIDNIPPTTTLEIGEPKYVDPMDNVYVTSATPFTLTAEDNPGGMGVASIFYRIYNNTYDTGWLEYSAPFYLTGLSDGEYSIDYYSTDTIGNTELTNTAKVILDNTPATTTLTIGEPKYISDTTYVTPDTPFTLEATDTGSGVYSIAYRIYNATYDSGWQTYTVPFYLTSLTDGAYTIEYNSTDNVKNVETTHAINVTLFHWNYIYQDTYGRGTTLKINLAHKFFQFIRPGKDYGIRVATYMKQCGRAIIISHCDKQLRLNTVSVDTKLDFCVAIAWDLQTRKCYFLIDKVGIE